MFCTKCGAKIEEGTKFCVKCGNPLSQTFISDTQSNEEDEEDEEETSNNENAFIAFIKRHYYRILCIICAGILIATFLLCKFKYDNSPYDRLYNLFKIHNQNLRDLLDPLVLGGSFVLLRVICDEYKELYFQLIGLIGIPLFCFILYCFQ